MKRFPPRKEFVAWLRAQPGGQQVGLRGKPCYCPVGLWLRKNGFPRASITAASCWFDGEQLVPCPDWVSAVVHAIDRSGAQDTWITARKVLQLIGEAP